jgi:hypothetical protein
MRVQDGTRLVVLALVVLAGTAVQSAELVPPSGPPDVALVFSGDVIGFIDPCG